MGFQGESVVKKKSTCQNVDSAPGVRKILWRREWHTGKNGQIVGVFVLYRNTCQKVPTVKKRKEKERKTYTSEGGDGG